MTIATVAFGLTLAAAHSAWADDGKYPQSVTDEGVSVKTRAQVVAETLEAARLGLLPGESERAATAEQERLIALAGQRAIEPQTVATK